MMRLIGQFVLAGLLSGMLPIDASQLEGVAGVGRAEGFGRLPSSQWTQVYAGLPVAESKITAPVKIDKNSFGIVTTAKSALVMDVASGEVLYEKHMDEVRSIGSVTKLMTNLVFLEGNPDLNATVELLPEDLVYGGRIYLAFNDGLSTEEVIAASLVGSDNSATKALERLSGLSDDEFLARMNEKAGELGMDSTHFADVTGVDARNVSTARDLTKLLAEAEKNQVMKRYMTSPSVTITHDSGRAVEIEHTNLVLESYLNEGDYAVEAGKTGFLPQAGYVLATMMRESGHDIFVIVMGADTKEDRVNEVKGLAAWAFKTFAWPDDQT